MAEEEADHHAMVSAESKAFARRIAEEDRGPTAAWDAQPGDMRTPSRAELRSRGSDAGVAASSPHHKAHAGADRKLLGISSPITHSKQKRHFDGASHLRSDHVDSSFKGDSTSFGDQGDAGTFSAVGGRAKPKQKFAGLSGLPTSQEMKGCFGGGAEVRAAGVGSGYEPPARRRVPAPFDVDESYYKHPLSPNSTLGHNAERHAALRKRGEEWREAAARLHPIYGDKVSQWQPKLKREATVAPDPSRNVITGSLKEDEVHTHIAMGSSSLGHWHTGVTTAHGKKRNDEVHKAVAGTQLSHGEAGIGHGGEDSRARLQKLVEQRLAEARARGAATPMHPSIVNDSPGVKSAMVPSPLPEGVPPEPEAAEPSAEDDGVAAAGAAGGSPKRGGRRRIRKSRRPAATAAVDL